MSPSPPEPTAPAIAEAPMTLTMVMVATADNAGQGLGQQDVPHNIPPIAPHRLGGFDETSIDLSEAHFGDAGEEGRRAGGKRHDGRPDPDRCSDEKPRDRQERDEENNERRGAESVHDRGKRPMQARRPDQPPGAARTRNTASGTPSATAMATDAPTIASVSRKAAQSRSTICGDITEYPCPIRDARELPHVPQEPRRTDRQQPAVDVAVNAVQ